VFSYDVVFSQRLQRYVDALEVSLTELTGQSVALLLRAGNPSQEYGTLYDSGWQMATIDLTPYAGRTLVLRFSNYNREDNLFNTWSFVDGIQVQDWPFSQLRYLPLARGAGVSASGLSFEPDSRRATSSPAATTLNGKR
jgi:hypothetical protein